MEGAIMAGNTNLNNSARDKQDEFYTELGVIEKELKYYKSHFQGKTVFCNCDDPEYSNFWKYFHLNFYALGLKKLIATHFEKTKQSYKMEIVAADISDDGQYRIPDYRKTPLKQNGDFRSPECLDILNEADIIVTNPPFSLFREYLDILIKSKKQFLIIANLNAVKYKEVLPLIMNNEIWLGKNSGHYWFKVPDYYEVKKTDFKIDENGQKWRRMGNICWFTNLDFKERHEDIPLYAMYDSNKYPKYDTYDAIEVSKVSEIPFDMPLETVFGVPITFIPKYNPEQFEIIGVLNSGSGNKYDFAKAIVKGKQLYSRFLIRRKR